MQIEDIPLKVTIEELERAILELWNGISETYISNLINSMPGRCREVITRAGDRIPY